MTLPIEPDKVLQFYEYATKGLMFSHWNSSLLPEHKCKAHFLSRGGELRLDMLLNTKRTNKVHVNLGEGTYEYEAVQSQDAAELTVWKFSLQGGANLGAGPNELVGHVGVLTGNNELAESFVG